MGMSKLMIGCVDGFVTDEDVSSRHGECGCPGKMARFWIVLPGGGGPIWLDQADDARGSDA